MERKIVNSRYQPDGADNQVRRQGVTTATQLRGPRSPGARRGPGRGWEGARVDKGREEKKIKRKEEKKKKGKKEEGKNKKKKKRKRKKKKKKKR